MTVSLTARFDESFGGTVTNMVPGAEGGCVAPPSWPATHCKAGPPSGHPNTPHTHVFGGGPCDHARHP